MARGEAAPFGADDDLRGRDLRKARLRRCDLSGRDLSGADLSLADLRRAHLEKTVLRGARLAGCRLRRARLPGADLRGADLSEADLCGADLRGADLSEADLSGAILEGACLESADLGRSKLAELSFRSVRLQQATLEGADLRRALLRDADLCGADLTGASLEEADLSFADLSGAMLTGANLARADLSGANLERADLREATVRGARLSWVLGLSPGARDALRERGARVPAYWLARPWARFNELARRRAGLLYVLGLALVAALATATALWVGGRIAGETIYPLPPAGPRPVYEVDCGSPRDRPFRGRAGHLGGAARRLEGSAGVQGAPRGTPEAYRTERQGEDFGYRFRLAPGWYEVQLHFAELDHRARGVRTFDIRIEDRVVARSFDILSAAPFGTALARSWAVLVDDGFLDLRLRRRAGRAKVNLIRVLRMDAAEQPR